MSGLMCSPGKDGITCLPDQAPGPRGLPRFDDAAMARRPLCKRDQLGRMYSIVVVPEGAAEAKGSRQIVEAAGHGDVERPRRRTSPCLVTLQELSTPPAYRKLAIRNSSVRNAAARLCRSSTGERSFNRIDLGIKISFYHTDVA